MIVGKNASSNGVEELDRLIVFVGCENGTLNRRKITRKHCCRGNVSRGSRACLRRTQPLIASKEEKPVANDSAAKGASILVLMESIFRRREEVRGVDVIVAN